MNKKIARDSLRLNEGMIFLHVGNLIERKDPVTVLKAFLKFQVQQPAARLYMIYQSAKLLDEAKALIGKNEAVCLVGKIEHSELQNWFTAADFIIAGSHHEGSGVAVIEAMSCGCIPILTSISSFRKMTGPNKCGVLFEPGNENDLFSVLLKTNEMNIEMESDKALKQYDEELSFKVIAEKIEKLVKKLDEQQ
jgi:glycosyltransferase involved in cell wall biosynthesis